MEKAAAPAAGGRARQHLGRGNPGLRHHPAEGVQCAAHALSYRAERVSWVQVDDLRGADTFAYDGEVQPATDALRLEKRRDALVVYRPAVPGARSPSRHASPPLSPVTGTARGAAVFLRTAAPRPLRTDHMWTTRAFSDPGCRVPRR
ncbi:hypothetical protein ACFQ0G_05750 [Streptomyces chiangmaiensis]